MATSKTDIKTTGNRRVYGLQAAADADVQSIIIPHPPEFLYPDDYLGEMECVSGISWSNGEPHTRKSGFSVKGVAAVDLDILIFCFQYAAIEYGNEDWGSASPGGLLVSVNGQMLFFGDRPLFTDGQIKIPYFTEPFDVDPDTHRFTNAHDSGLTISIIGGPQSRFLIGEMFRLQAKAGQIFSGPHIMPPSVKIVPVHAAARLAQWVVDTCDNEQIIVKKIGTSAGCAASGAVTARLEVDYNSSLK